MVNHQNLLVKTSEDQARLNDVLKNIQKHHNFLQEQFDAYKEYLGNVRQQSVCTGRGKQKGDDKKKKKEKGKSKTKAKGPFKYSHSQLEKDGVIIESEAPEDRFVIFIFEGILLIFLLFFFFFFSKYRRSSISFSFSSISPGEFEVVVTFGRRPIAKMQLKLDDLLERQHNNLLEYETDFLKLNVNLLLHLLNKDFVT